MNHVRRECGHIIRPCRESLIRFEGGDVLVAIPIRIIVAFMEFIKENANDSNDFVGWLVLKYKCIHFGI